MTVRTGNSDWQSMLADGWTAGWTISHISGDNSIFHFICDPQGNLWHKKIEASDFLTPHH